MYDTVVYAVVDERVQRTVVCGEEKEKRAYHSDKAELEGLGDISARNYSHHKEQSAECHASERKRYHLCIQRLFRSEKQYAAVDKPRERADANYYVCNQ